MFSISFSNSEESQRQLFLSVCFLFLFPIAKNHNDNYFFSPNFFFYFLILFIFLHPFKTFIIQLHFRFVNFMYVFWFSIRKESKLTYYLFSPNIFLFFETFYFYATIQNFCYSSCELILKL